MPAEWERHERTLIAWPVRRGLWRDQLDHAKQDYAVIARTIAEGEPVLVIAAPGDGREAAAACGDRVDVIELPLDDSWLRDTGPVVVRSDGTRCALDFTFTGWGGRYTPFDQDDAVAGRLAEHLGLEHRRVDLVLEGGAVTVDGHGALATTEQCLLHPNRNPTRSRAEIEAALREHLGANVVLWLPFGLVEDRDTDGHVDNVAAFVQPGRLVLQGEADPTAPNSARLRANARRARDGGYDVAVIPVLPYATVGGRTVPVPYLNWYVAAHAVLVPTTGHPADADVLRGIGRRVGRPARAVPGAVLAYGGGGVHCVTQQVPASDMRGGAEPCG
jgi:agmatine deiminase